MKKFLLKYKFAIASLIFLGVMLIVRPDIGRSMTFHFRNNLFQMISAIPPVFLLLGLLDAWIPKQTIMKYMGDDSGVTGSLLTFFLATAAAGPLYVAFPIAAALIKKEVKLFNIFLFLGVWTSMKIPFLLFETANMGARYMALRLVCNFVGVVSMAWILAKTTSRSERQRMMDNASGM